MRRVLAFLMVAAAVLLVLVAGGVQAVLWSDLPRQILTAELEKALGLEARIDDARTGWLGQTRLEGVVLRLPLEDEPLLEAAAIEVDHASLLRLVIVGDLGLRRLDVDRPRIHARQAESGRWNLQQLVEILDSRFAGGDEGGDSGSLELPEIMVRDAMLEVTRTDVPTVTIGPVQVRGGGASRLSYGLTVQSPQLGEVAAQFTPSDPWHHEATFELQPDAPLVAALAGETAPTPVVMGRWQGTFAGGVVKGLLDLDEVSARPSDEGATEAGVGGGPSAVGRVAMRFDAQSRELVLRPRDLAVHLAGTSAAQTAHVNGELIYTLGDLLRLNDVVVTGLGVQAVVAGELDPVRQAGTVTTSWRSSDTPEAVRHGGRVELMLSRSATGRRGVQMQIDARAETPAGEMDAQASVRAFGPGWSEMTGRVLVERLHLQRGDERFHIDAAEGRFAIGDGSVRLVGFGLPRQALPRRLEVAGYYDEDGQWELRAEAAAFAVPGVPFGLDQLLISLRGTPERATLESLSVRNGSIELEAAGAYVYREPQPLTMNVTLKQVPIRMTAGDVDMPSVVADNLQGLLKVRGVVSPLNLEAAGELTARSLAVGGDALGDIVMQVEAAIDGGQAEVVAEAPKWLGGQWRVEGVWDRLGRQAQLRVGLEAMDLALAQQALDLPVDLEGVAGFAMTVDVPQTAPERFLATGTFQAEHLIVTGPGSRVESERLDGQVVLDARSLKLTEVVLRQGEATIRAEAEMALALPREVGLKAALHDWPILLPTVEGQVRVTGDGALEFEPGDGRLRARTDLDMRLHAREQDMGRLSLEASAVDRRFTLHRLNGELLDGTVHGEGVVDIANLIGSALTLQWQGIQPALLVPWLAPAEEVDGRVSGSITARRAEDPRALAPLQITMELDASEADVRGLAMGQGFATAYTDGDRFVLEKLELQAAGGVLDLWGRISPHQGRYHLYTSAFVRDLDIQAITQALMPDRDVVGRVDAEMTLSTPLDDLRVAFGRGRIEVRESDLANIPLFGALFNLINLRIGEQQPDGRGLGDLRIEEGYVILNGFRYQNRGTQINLVPLRIQDLGMGEQSPISGAATLTQNLLPELEFFGDVNEALSVLQSDLVAARIEGTLGEPRVSLQAMRGLTGEIGDIITGGSRAPDSLKTPSDPEEGAGEAVEGGEETMEGEG